MRLESAIKSEEFLLGLFIISIYFSTSLSIILSVLIGFIWLFTGRYKTFPYVLKSSPIALCAVLLLMTFLVGLTYSNVSLKEGFKMINKYRELFFIPVLLSFLDNERTQSWAWKAFFLASIASLLGSYLMYFGFIDLNKQGDACFKSRITYSIFMAYFAFICFHKIKLDQKFSVIYLIAALLCFHNLFFVVQGRSGELILLALTALFAGQKFSIKGFLLAAIVIAVSVTLFVNFSGKASRLHQGMQYSEDLFTPSSEKKDSSMELRYGFWKQSLYLISQRPLIGSGTGSFEKTYQDSIVDKKLATSNPHNEFMMIGVQLGMLGLLFYIGLYWSQFYCVKFLINEQRYYAQGILLTLLVTSLFNSPLLDHAEGHWFALMIALCFGSYPCAPNRINQYN